MAARQMATMPRRPMQTRATIAAVGPTSGERLSNPERAFAHIARELRELGYPAELIDAATRVSQDEGKHVGLCATLAKELGAKGPASIPTRVQLAPSRLSREDGIVYEVVARCCVAE